MATSVIPLVNIVLAAPASASVVYASDSFNRTVTNGWGAADVGGTWSGTGPQFSVTPGTATIQGDQTVPTTFLPLAIQDVDVLAEITPPPISSAYFDVGVAARATPSSGSFYQLSMYYASSNNDGNYTVELKRKPDNTQINPDVNTNIPGGSPVWVRFEAEGTAPTTLQWKIWQVGTPEPAAWDGTASDNTAALQVAGAVGVEAYASSGSAAFGFNSFTASAISSPVPTVSCSLSIACDTFGRTVSGGWGTADVGGAWSTTGSGFSVVPGEGIMPAQGSAPTTFLSAVSARDVDAEVEISPPAETNAYVDVGLAVREAQGAYYQLSAYYASGNNNGDYTMEIKAEPSNTSIVQNVNTTIPGGTSIWLRLQAEGTSPTVLRAMIWQDGTPEPGGWTTTATDNTTGLQGPGAVGVKAYAGTAGTTNVAFDGLVVDALSPPPPPPIATCPSGAIVCDTFNRTSTNGWGSADSGQSWSTTGSVWAVTPGEGTVLADPTAPTNFIDSSIGDVDMVAKITPPGISTSYVDAGIAVRYSPSTTSFYQLSAYYASGNNNGNYTVELKRKPANTAIVPNYNTSVPGGSPFWLQLDAQGTNPTTLRWKIWQDGTTAPSSWMGTATDSTPALQNPGGVGVIGYVSGYTTTVGFNALWATPSVVSAPSPQPFACDATAIACDTYNRTVTGGWGTADLGGSWSIPTTPSNWSVSPGEGSVQVPAGAQEIGILGSQQVRDVEVLQKIVLPPVTQNTADAYVLGRYVGGPSPTYYRVGIIQGSQYPDVMIRVQRADGTYVEGDMPTSIPTGSGAAIWLRVQFQGSYPTAIRARAWLDGTQEPSFWNVATTDSTPAMQGPGAIGIRDRNENFAAGALFATEGFEAVPLPPPTSPASSADLDVFDRTLTGSWGTADSGGAWTTSGSGYGVVPGQGLIQTTSATPTNFLLGNAFQDVDLTALVSPPALTSAYVDSGIAVRYNAGSFYQLSAYYAAGNNNGDYTIQLKRKPANSTIIADVNTSIPGGTAIWFRLQAQGVNPTTLSWMVWQDGTPQPTSWMGTATDSTAAMQTAGGVGIECFQNSGTQSVAFNQFSAGPIG